MALEELTRVLPDDTWVQQLDIKGKELQIQGETASSFRLIGLFEQSAMFHDASFRAPLIKGQSSGSERYQLALQMQPMAGKAATPATSPTAATSPTPATPAASASSPAALPPASAPAPEKKP